MSVKSSEVFETSVISNLWGAASAVKLDVRHVPIFKGGDGHGFNHQAQIVSDDSRLYATWSSAAVDEEEAGQQMLMSYSNDWGLSWSSPIVVAPSRPGQYANSVVVSSGMRPYEGALIAYYGEWERWEPKRDRERELERKASGRLSFNLRTEARVSHDQGQSWSDSTLVVSNQMGFMPPLNTHTGRLILPGHLTYAYTDDPWGLSGWRRSGLPGLPHDYYDDWYGHSEGARMLGIEHRFNEANFFQTDDDVLHMMLRNEAGTCMGVSESRDNGATWSKPVLTEFSNSVSRSHFGRLPDGRYFCVSCPTPASPGAAPSTRTPRTPLILALSRDGRTFDRHYVLGDEPQGLPRVDGYLKHGRYGYPYLHSVGNRAFVIYSVNKEDIYLAQFDLPAEEA